MRRFCIGTALILLAATVRAEDEAERPVLVLNTGGHTAPIVKVLFTPDGKEVVTVSGDQTIRLWDPTTGERLGVLRTPFGLKAADLSPDGRTLAVGGYGRIFLIDLAELKLTAAMPSAQTVTKLAYSHDGNAIAAGRSDGAVDLWDAASHRLLRHARRAQALGLRRRFLPRRPAAGHRVRRPHGGLWSVGTGKEAAEPLKHEDKVTCVAWKDDDTLATGGWGHTFIHLWDRTGKHLKHFDKLRASPPSSSPSRSSQRRIIKNFSTPLPIRETVRPTGAAAPS